MDTNGSFLWVFPLALGLDLLSGDPCWLPHPIRWMGSAIEKLEPRFRALHLPVSLSGGLMSLGLIFCTWLLCRSLLFWTYQVWPLLSWVLAVVMVFYTLSIRSLADAAGEVYKAIKQTLSKYVPELIKITHQEGVISRERTTLCEHG